MYHLSSLYKEGGGGSGYAVACRRILLAFGDREVLHVLAAPEDAQWDQAFSEGSHTFTYGRNFKISDEIEQKILKSAFRCGSLRAGTV